MGYDPNGNWNWGSFWKIVGGVVGSIIGSVIGSSLGALTGNPIIGNSYTNVGMVLGAIGGTNISTVIESNYYVKHTKIEMMDSDTYDSIQENAFDIGLSRKEKLSYIRRHINNNPSLLQNWNEAQMLREMEYHERGFKVVKIFGENSSIANRLKKTDFEEKQNFKTYLFRIIGNCMFW